MTDDQLPALSPELASIFSVERTAPVSNPAERARIRGAVAATIAGLLPPAAPAAGGAGGMSLATKLIALAVSLGAIGGGIAWYLHARGDDSRAAAVAVAPSAASSPSQSMGSPQRSPSPDPRSFSPGPRSSPAAPQHVQPNTAPRTESPAAPSEAELLTRAWSALAARDAAAALDLTVRAHASYPDGALAEEREALAIIALHRLHRDAEAKPRATAFSRQYPSSIHAPLLARELADPR